MGAFEVKPSYLTSILNAQLQGTGKALTGQEDIGAQDEALWAKLGVSPQERAAEPGWWRGLTNVGMETVRDPLTYETLGLGALGHLAKPLVEAASKAVSSKLPYQVTRAAEGAHDFFTYAGEAKRAVGVPKVKQILGAEERIGRRVGPSGKLAQQFTAKVERATKGLSPTEVSRVENALQGFVNPADLTTREDRAYRILDATRNRLHTLSLYAKKLDPTMIEPTKLHGWVPLPPTDQALKEGLPARTVNRLEGFDPHLLERRGEARPLRPEESEAALEAWRSAIKSKGSLLQGKMLSREVKDILGREATEQPNAFRYQRAPGPGIASHPAMLGGGHFDLEHGDSYKIPESMYEKGAEGGSHLLQGVRNAKNPLTDRDLYRSLRYPGGSMAEYPPETWRAALTDAGLAPELVEQTMAHPKKALFWADVLAAARARKLGYDAILDSRRGPGGKEYGEFIALRPEAIRQAGTMRRPASSIPDSVKSLFDVNIPATGQQRNAGDLWREGWNTLKSAPKTAVVGVTPGHIANMASPLGGMAAAQPGGFKAIVQAAQNFPKNFAYMKGAATGERTTPLIQAALNHPLTKPLGQYMSTVNRATWAVDKGLHDSFMADLVQQGMHPDQARQEAREMMVDYEHLSPFATALKTVMPFGTWNTGIWKQIVRGVVKNPARAAAINRVTGGYFYGGDADLPGIGRARSLLPAAEIGRAIGSPNEMAKFARKSLAIPVDVGAALVEKAARPKTNYPFGTYGLDPTNPKDAAKILGQVLTMGVPEASTALGAAGMGPFKPDSFMSELLRQATRTLPLSK
jgi:hypothetical protein